MGDVPLSARSSSSCSSTAPSPAVVRTATAVSSSGAAPASAAASAAASATRLPLLPAFEAEGLLGLTVALLPRPAALPAAKLGLYWPVLDRYLAHTASTVRQVSSLFFCGVLEAVPTELRPPLVLLSLQSLAHGWHVDIPLLSHQRPSTPGSPTTHPSLDLPATATSAAAAAAATMSGGGSGGDAGGSVSVGVGVGSSVGVGGVGGGGAALAAAVLAAAALAAAALALTGWAAEPQAVAVA